MVFRNVNLYRLFLVLFLTSFIATGIANAGGPSGGENSNESDGLSPSERALYHRMCHKLLLTLPQPNYIDGYTGPADLEASEILRRYRQRTFLLDPRNHGLTPPLPFVSEIPTFAAILDHLLLTEGWSFHPLVHKDPSFITGLHSTLPDFNSSEIHINPAIYSTDLTLDILAASVFLTVSENFHHYDHSALGVIKSGLTPEVRQSLKNSTGEGVPKKRKRRPSWQSGGEDWKNEGHGGGTATKVQQHGGDAPQYSDLDELIEFICGTIAAEAAYLRGYTRLIRNHPELKTAELDRRSQSLQLDAPLIDVIREAIDQTTQFSIENYALSELARVFLSSGLIEKWGLSALVLGKPLNAQLTRSQRRPDLQLAVLRKHLGRSTVVLPDAIGRRVFFEELNGPIAWFDLRDKNSSNAPLHPSIPGPRQLIGQQGQEALVLTGNTQPLAVINKLNVENNESLWRVNFSNTLVQAVQIVDGRIYLFLSSLSLPSLRTLQSIDWQTGEISPPIVLPKWSTNVLSFQARTDSKALLWVLGDGNSKFSKRTLYTDFQGKIIGYLDNSAPVKTALVATESNGDFWLESLQEVEGFSAVTLVRVSLDGKYKEKVRKNTFYLGQNKENLFLLEQNPQQYASLIAVSRESGENLWKRSLKTVLDLPYEVLSVRAVFHGHWAYLSTADRIYAVENNADTTTTPVIVFERPKAHILSEHCKSIQLATSGVNHLHYTYVRKNPAAPEDGDIVEYGAIPFLP